MITELRWTEFVADLIPRSSDSAKEDYGIPSNETTGK